MSGERCEVAEFAERVRRLILDLDQFYEPADIITWLDSPQRVLGGQRPSVLLRTQEGSEEVAAVIARLRDGTYT